MIRSGFDEKISLLGLGCMRFPCIDGDDARPDREKVQELVDTAMRSGVNYFDTAWCYHEEKSEETIGEALSKYERGSYYLADKFPGYDVSNMGKVKEIFEEQLKRCKTDYFDFYLLHNLCEMNIKEYLDPAYGVIPYLLEQKKNGRIKHLGFSTHARIETLKEFFAAFEGDIPFEFCQIQLNWLDYHFQEAYKKVDLLNELNIPIWVMEPVRGGRLIWLENEHAQMLEEAAPGRSTAEWAFRFIESMPGVSLILSGMTEIDQLNENIRIFESKKTLTEEEISLLFSIASQMTEGVPCTKCHYCTPHCPQGIDIPLMISLYNENTFTKGGWRAPKALQAIPEDKWPRSCLSCGACSAVCPQKIDIPAVMKDFAKQLLIPPSEPQPVLQYKMAHPEKFKS